MPDVTVKAIDEMEPIYDGLARRARAELGVTAWADAGVHASARLGRLRRCVRPGPEGIRFVAIGGAPGAFRPGAWTELGADPPSPPAE